MPSQFEVPSEFEGSSQFDLILRNGSSVVAEAIRACQAGAIRARGDQRRRRQVIGSALTAAAIVAAGGVAITHVTAADQPVTPTPSTSHHHTSSHHHTNSPVHAVIAPDVVVAAEPSAVSILTSLGFHVVIEVGPCHSAVLPAGSVCAMEPAPGARVPAGSTVVLYVVPQRRH